MEWRHNLDEPQTTPLLGTTTTTAIVGTGADTSSWGGHAWSYADFSNANFVIRLTANKGCGSGTTFNVNMLDVRVTWDMATTPAPTTAMTTTNGVNDGTGSPPAGGAFLTSRGAFGAVITKGGDQSNGDAYSPVTSSKTQNTYNPDGYDYVVKLPAGGAIKVFDPGFCAMGPNGAGGSMGTGDHWIGTAGTPVSTYYTVWNTNGKPGMQAAWSQLYTSASLFENQKGYDPDNMASGNGNATATPPSGAHGHL